MATTRPPKTEQADVTTTSSTASPAATATGPVTTEEPSDGDHEDAKTTKDQRALTAANAHIVLPDTDIRNSAPVARIMKNALPENAKIAKEAKECMQECVSEFISFITSEASEKCQQEKRKTVNGEDILFAMTSLGFENYAEALKIYLAKYRESQSQRNQPEGGQQINRGSSGGPTPAPQPPTSSAPAQYQPATTATSYSIPATSNGQHHNTPPPPSLPPPSAISRGGAPATTAASTAAPPTSAAAAAALSAAAGYPQQQHQQQQQGQGQTLSGYQQQQQQGQQGQQQGQGGYGRAYPPMQQQQGVGREGQGQGGYYHGHAVGNGNGY